MKTNIYLIGFMGSGKTTIGKLLADQMQRHFIDLDEEIKNYEKRSIPYIFETKGEDYFREIESKVLLQTQDIQLGIVSTGGGIISREINRKFLKKQQTVYLEWDFGTLYERIENDPNRPNAKSYEQLKCLYESRIDFYESTGTYRVSCENKSKKEIVREVIKWLGGEL